MFICHRTRRPDAIDAETGERMDDVLMFRVESLEVKDIILADDRGIYFTTPHFNGYPAVLVNKKKKKKKKKTKNKKKKKKKRMMSFTSRLSTRNMSTSSIRSPRLSGHCGQRCGGR